IWEAMAFPRPALLGIVGVVLILVTFVAIQKVGKGNSSSSSTHAQAQKAHTPAVAKHAAAKPVKHSATAPAKHSAISKQNSVKKSAPVKVNVPAGPKAGASVGLPANVAQAFAKRQTVVLFFGATGS